MARHVLSERESPWQILARWSRLIYPNLFCLAWCSFAPPYLYSSSGLWSSVLLAFLGCFSFSLPSACTPFPSLLLGSFYLLLFRYTASWEHLVWIAFLNHLPLSHDSRSLIEAKKSHNAVFNQEHCGLPPGYLCPRDACQTTRYSSSEFRC